MMVRQKDNPEAQAPDCPPGLGDKIMHATLRIGKTVMIFPMAVAPVPQTSRVSPSR